MQVLRTSKIVQAFYDGARIDYSPWPSGSMIKYKRRDGFGQQDVVELIDLRDFDIGAQRRWPEDEN